MSASNVTGLVVGTGAWVYDVIRPWGTLPAGWSFGPISHVAVDSKDRVYVFNRSPRAEMMVFDASGRLLTTWGLGQFFHPHAYVNEGRIHRTLSNGGPGEENRRCSCEIASVG